MKIALADCRNCFAWSSGFALVALHAPARATTASKSVAQLEAIAARGGRQKSTRHYQCVE